MSLQRVLNKLVTIQDCGSTFVSGTIRQRVADWRDNATNVETGIYPISSSARSIDLGKYPDATHVIYFRKTATIKQGWRVVDGTDVYEVRGIDDWSQRSIVIRCVAAKQNG